MVGHKVSEEVKVKLRLALIGRPLSEETKAKMKGRIPWNKGKKNPYTPEQLERIRIGRRAAERVLTPEGKQGFHEKMVGHKLNVGRHPSEETRRKLSVANKGKQNTLGHKLTEAHKAKIGIGLERFWQDRVKSESMLKKILQGTHRRPTRPERDLLEILESDYPNEFAYNGDFSCGVVIDRMVPDFVNLNGEKAVIEVFGRAFHDESQAWKPLSYKSTEGGRLQAYKDLGYKCLIIWDTDFREQDTVKSKLRAFIPKKPEVLNGG